MAPSLVWEELRHLGSRKLTVLDPMTGSGTTVVAARSLGHRGIGFDTDPLAVLIARAWSSDTNMTKVVPAGERVLRRARRLAKHMSLASAYPDGASDSTREFVRYWFDKTARKHLAALALGIGEERDSHVRDLLWCAFSRLIIVKQAGASLAMDVAHSRPHKVYDRAPLKPLEGYERALRRVLTNAPFVGAETASSTKAVRPRASVQLGDARALPLARNSVDIVVTSPPYLNAIDYLRGHKFSLIWMGHDVETLRTVRANNVGTEVSALADREMPLFQRALKRMGACDLPSRESGMLLRYLQDMQTVLSEVVRVLKPEGRLILVVGNSTLRGTFIENSQGLKVVASNVGLSLSAQRTRPLPANRRYLPPPGSTGTGEQLEGRMREEVIMTLTRS